MVRFRGAHENDRQPRVGLRPAQVSCPCDDVPACIAAFLRHACGIDARSARLGDELVDDAPATAWSASGGRLADVTSAVLRHVGLMVTTGTAEVLSEQP